ncbi:hypothetical protein SynA15127_02371 [Synechococcus sp. A15-127]|uniref:HAD family hydrolase n=1 Tax=Synechococcus sp. A15-127 TaxID=1050624 RepID=UPI0016473C42|nr:HAD family hydrolase [Synechococcus sp. A15-127]QNI95435.1 hypothetical protein SynA15127_02371 [Synechococcus sp. A15-127]
MKIGLDFDNTIACYDNSISLLSEKISNLPTSVNRTKLGLRDFLRSQGRESEWTEFQGELYGPGMCHAEPFPDAIKTMQLLSEYGHDLVIVSHRSRYPYAGPSYDLHSFALQWIDTHLKPAGLFLDSGSEEKVYFLETRDLKLSQISNLNCAVFLDDLQEVLNSPLFPDNTFPILFKPFESSEKVGISNMTVISCWPELLKNLP